MEFGKWNLAQQFSASVENPESNNQIYSIAPAEGEKPISFMTDKDFETMQ